jgi:hypothetical protein
MSVPTPFEMGAAEAQGLPVAESLLRAVARQMAGPLKSDSGKRVRVRLDRRAL